MVTVVVENSAQVEAHLVAGDEDGCPGEEPRDGLARGVLQEGAVELHRAVLLLLRSRRMSSSVKLGVFHM